MRGSIRRAARVSRSASNVVREEGAVYRPYAMTEAVPSLVLCDFPAKTGLDGWDSFSPFVLQVSRALKLAKLPFEHRHVNMMKIGELNPKGQLPVLIVGTENVADSTLILHRIESLSPGSMTGGLDARGVAEAWLWEEFADTALYAHVLATRWADDRGWPLVREAFFGAMPPVIRSVVASLVRKKTLKALVGRDFLRGGVEACHARLYGVLDALDARAPENGFWLGARATAADLGLFAHLHSMRLPGTPYQAEQIAKRVRLSRYLDRVDAATRS
jgi:glutathione S-transferase